MQTPSKKYINLMRKIELLSFFQLKKLAIKKLKEQLENEGFTNNEKSSGLIRLGFLLANVKEYGLAADVFNEALNMSKKERFPYNPYFKTILRTFEKAGRDDLVEYWTNDLKERVRYDI
jgi:hypothetical protein